MFDFGLRVSLFVRLLVRILCGFNEPACGAHLRAVLLRGLKIVAREALRAGLDVALILWQYGQSVPAVARAPLAAREPAHGYGQYAITSDDGVVCEYDERNNHV